MNKRLRQLLFWGGSLTIIFVLCENKSSWTNFLWILVWAAFLGLMNLAFTLRRRRREVSKTVTTTKTRTPDPRIDTPRKALRAVFNYGFSNALFFLNPFLVIQTILQLAGVYWERKFGHPVLQAEQYQQKGNYILPVAGEWQVFNGGVTRETSHSWGIPTQRFAYDLIKLGDNGRAFNGNGRKLTDYACFDASILAPADGLVIKASDGIHDAPFVGTFWMDCFTRNIAGNFVVIKHAEGEYCLLAHLKRGSVRVKTGDGVRQGQEIGRCGHSGNSSEPHLHFQFQNGESFYFSSGLPVKFSRFYRRDSETKTFIEQDYIAKKTFIAAAE